MATDLGEPMTEDELLRLIDDEIEASISFDTDLSVGGNDALRERSLAIEYRRGEMRDLPALPNWSSAVSRDVADTIDFMLPGLMRVFAGAGQIAVYQPAKAGDEESAAQATDYVNFLWDSELNGYQVLTTWIDDGLIVRNGIVKVYWDPTPEYEHEELSALTDEQLVLLQEDPEVEIAGYQPREQTVQDPQTGQTIPLVLHDVRVRRMVLNGRLTLENVPPEDFGVSARARSLEGARMVWHRTRETRSDLIKRGFDPEEVNDLPAYSRPATATAEDREDSGTLMRAPFGGGALEEVEVYECYPLADLDGDGITERLRVVVAGGRGGRKLLSVDPWPDGDLPFQDWTPKPVSHRWMGQSVADDVMDLQRIKTALLRSYLNNAYQVAVPQRVVDNEAVLNPDELLVLGPGAIIRAKKGQAQTAVVDLVAPYIGDKLLQGIQYVDTVIQRRTGVSQSSAALDATALQPQTATAEAIEHDANYARIELVARNLAELGLKPLFRKILRIIVRNQDRPRMIRLRDKWVDMDPRVWNAAMDVTVNVGLGTGSRERDLAMLAGISAQQDLVVKELGLGNPIVPVSKWVRTRHKMVEASGVRDADEYFTPTSDEEFAAWRQANPPPPDPKAQAQAAKLEADMQAEQVRMQRQAEIERRQAEADLVVQEQKAALEMRLREQQAEIAERMKAMELDAQIHLERMKLQLRAQVEAARQSEREDA